MHPKLYEAETPDNSGSNEPDFDAVSLELHKERSRRWDAFIEDRGRRYATCRFENFECDTPKKTDAVEQLQAFAGDTSAAHRNLLLWGPSGTGKDHLLAACVHRFLITRATIPSIEWTSGPRLFSQLRSAISQRESDGSVTRSLKQAGVLVVSDLAMTTLTDFQREVLYDIVDSRYSNARPIWLSANVVSRKALEEATSVQIVDRLIDDAVYVSCNWPSYRKVEANAGLRSVNWRKINA